MLENINNSFYLSLSRKFLYSIIIVGLFLLVMEVFSSIYIISTKKYQTMNLYSYRERIGKDELTPEETGKTLKLYMYGESTVQGLPVPEVGFVAQLEYYLSTIFQGRRLKIANFSDHGNNSSSVVEKIERTIHGKPDAMIVFTAHNEFIDLRLRRPAGAFFLFCNRLSCLKIIKLSSNPRIREFFTSGKYGQFPERNTKTFNNKVEIFRDNIRLIIKIAERNHVPLLICTASSNIRDWPPSVCSDPKELSLSDRDIKIMIDFMNRDEYSKAFNHGENILLKYPDLPMVLYETGRAAYRLKDFQNAKKLLIKAKDLDPWPWRILSRFNEIIKEEVSNSNAILVDIEKLYDEIAPGGCPGSELFIDQCHPTPWGYFLIAQEMIKKLALALPEKSEELLKANCDLVNFMYHIPVNSEFEFSYMLKVATYCLRYPCPNYSAASKAFDKCLELEPGNWIVWANMATISLSELQIDLAKSQLSRALELKKDGINLQDFLVLPGLETALREKADLCLKPGEKIIEELNELETCKK